MKVIVIGAGIIGSNVAWRLAQKGASVIVVEAERPGGGTSGNSFAWVNSHRKPPRSYHELNVRGMQAHRALRKEFPDYQWWGGKGALEWQRIGQSAEEFEQSLSDLTDWGYKCGIIDRERLKGLAPEVDAFAFPDHQIAYFEEEGWVAPVQMIHCLLQAARGAGAEVLTMTGPASLIIQSGRAKGVRIAETEVEADVVVNCAGWRVNSVMEDDALHIPMAPTLGMLPITPPVSGMLDKLILGPECEIRADGSGRLMLHSEEIDHRLKPNMDRDAIHALGAEIVSRARKLIPSIGEVSAEVVRIGTRARPEDGMPAVGPIPGLENYTVVTTHSGVTLSPWLGCAVADEVLDGKSLDELAEYRPARFFQEQKPAAQPWVRD